MSANVIEQTRARFRPEEYAIVDECLTFRPVRKVSEWASEVRRIAPGQSPFAVHSDIPYDHAIMPHCVEPMDAADDPSVHKIVLWFAIRDGKTLGICANIIGRTCTDDPGNIYSVHPTDSDADRFGEGDIEPMIDCCLGEANFVEKKSRDSGRTKDFKKYAGGWIRIVSAGSQTKFRGTSVKVMLLHELDALDAESIHKALNRTTGFSDAIIVEESTGTIAATYDENNKKVYHSHIEEAYDQGDKRKWFVPCQDCKKPFVIRFEHIRVPAIDRAAEAFVQCPFCGEHHNENQWRRMQSRGKWYPTAGLTEDQEADIERWHNTAKPIDPAVRSYWRNGFNSLLLVGKGYKTKLHQFVAEEAASHSSPEARKTWLNEVAAELWSDDGEATQAPPYQPILDGREDYATLEQTRVPSRGRVVTCFTDLHSNRLEVEWRAWARDEESWGLGHFVLHGDTSRPEVWQDWTNHLQTKWTHESGLEMQMSLAFVDGGWRCDPIMAVLRRLAAQNVPGVSGKVMITKGVGLPGAGIIHRRWATISNRAKGHHIGTWAAKELIYERLAWHSAAVKPEGGFFHFGKCYTEEFIRQAVSEKPVKKIINAREVLTFKNPDGNRNEALDMLVGNLAAFRIKRWDFDTIERQIAEHISEPERKIEQAAPMARVSVMGGGWKL